MEETLTLAQAADIIVVGTFCVVCFSFTMYCLMDLLYDLVQWIRKRREKRKAKKAEATETEQ